MFNLMQFRFFLLSALLCGCNLNTEKQGKPDASIESEPNIQKKQWLAGDHHIHSRYSATWDHSTTPPTPILGGDAHYSTVLNAQMAAHHGLSWMAITDHGGPNHSKLNLDQAYPDLLASRKAVPQVIQFYGMEFDTPGARHSSLIIPHSHHESQQLFELEKTYNRREVYPEDPARDTEERMLDALTVMKEQKHQPIVIANHPGRTATDLGEYTKVTPTELRNWHNTAPTVAIGMEGAPGHQANALNPDGSIKPTGIRGGYHQYPTLGGFDQMTAKLGGFWDSMLAEGRHWWITATSDSHVHYTEGRTDFWPGEYSKTYVYSEKTYQGILSGLRSGRVFVTTGDLIAELYVTAEVKGKHAKAHIGDTLVVEPNDSIIITITFLDPDSNNARRENPSVKRVDLITGLITGPYPDKSTDTNPSTRVLNRFTTKTWTKDGRYTQIKQQVDNLTEPVYIRVRGTNQKMELEPEADPAGEDPWSDLWFYSNPIFIKMSPGATQRH